MMHTIDAKYLQPGFSFKCQILQDAMVNTPSLLDIKFVNGYERKYDVNLVHFRQMKAEIDYINHLVEYERASNGQDDEMDDEA